MEKDIENSYNTILVWMVHLSFACYTIGYAMGLGGHLSYNNTSLITDDAVIIGIFLITYIFLISTKTSMKILSMVVVLDMLYPGIILPGDLPSVDYPARNIIMVMILVFMVAFTTDKAYAILINIAVNIILLATAITTQNIVMLEMLPTVVLCLAGMGAFSIVFENLIKKLLDRAVESKNKIQELSDYKQNMIQHIIHDLKVPVNSILNLSSVSESNETKKIKAQAENINVQLEKVLDVERFEQAGIELNLEKISVEGIIEEAVKSVETIAKAKNISIHAEYKTSGELRCDQGLVIRVITNLLSNALKFSPAGEKITVSITGAINHCQISVTDNGIGIAPEHLANIFDKFYTVKSKKGGDYFSTGLGLSFCKLVVEAHGGNISVKSEEGKETVFEISFPRFNEQKQVSFKRAYFTEVIYTLEEKRKIIKKCQQIKDIPVYRVGEIIKMIDDLASSKSKNIRIWHERLSEAVYSGNQEFYRELMSSFLIPDMKETIT